MYLYTSTIRQSAFTLVTFTLPLTGVEMCHLVTMPLLSLLMSCCNTCTWCAPIGGTMAISSYLSYLEQCTLCITHYTIPPEVSHSKKLHLISPALTYPRVNSHLPRDCSTLHFTYFLTEPLLVVITDTEYSYPCRIYWLTLLHDSWQLCYLRICHVVVLYCMSCIKICFILLFYLPSLNRLPDFYFPFCLTPLTIICMCSNV